MRVYFQDGKMIDDDVFNISIICLFVPWQIDAKYGVSDCKYNLNFIASHDPDAVVYTNSLVALNNDYVWNDELNIPELYLKRYNYKTDVCEWIRIDKLTDKEIKKKHNLRKMYLAGKFDEDWSKDE